MLPIVSLTVSGLHAILRPMRVLFVIILLAALVLPSGCASVSPPIDISAEDLQTLHARAAQGDAAAQTNLGVLYANGHGVPREYVQSYMWWSLVAGRSMGNDQKLAAEYRDRVAYRMTPEQITQAQEMASRCQAQNFKGC
jgi:hypothetical protein